PVVKNLGGQGPRWRWREREIPVYDTNRRGKALTGFLMSDNYRARREQPLIALRVVKVPVGSYEPGDRIGTEPGQCVPDSWTRSGNSRVNKELAVGPRQYCDVTC